MDWWKTLYLLTSTKSQIYAFIVHAHFSLAEQSLAARCKKMDQCPTLLGVLLWVISLFSQGVWSPEGELWRTWTWALKQDNSTSGKHLHSQFIPENRVSSQQRGRTSVKVPETKDWMHGKCVCCFLIILFPKYWLLGSSGTKINPLHLVCYDIKYTCIKPQQTLFKGIGPYFRI